MSNNHFESLILSALECVWVCVCVNSGWPTVLMCISETLWSLIGPPVKNRNNRRVTPTPASQLLIQNITNIKCKPRKQS